MSAIPPEPTYFKFFSEIPISISIFCFSVVKDVNNNLTITKITPIPIRHISFRLGI